VPPARAFNATQGQGSPIIIDSTTSKAYYYNAASGVMLLTANSTGITSFNARIGAVTLTSADVTTALGYIPVSTPAGSTTQVQFNDAGSFAGNSGFTYDKATNTLTVGNITGSGAAVAGIAPSLTIKPRSPIVTEVGGDLVLTTPNAVKANTSSGALTLTTGSGSGTERGGIVQLYAGAGSTGGLGAFLSATGGDVLSGGTFTMNGGVNAAGSTGATALMTGALSNNNGGYCLFGGGNSANVSGLSRGGDCDFFCGAGDTPFLSGVINFKDSLINPVISVSDYNSSSTLAFFAGVLRTQRPAYVKTYSTASRTIPNATFTNLATTASTNVAPYGFTTAAQADAIATKVNQLAADVIALKKIIVSLVDDSSATLGFGLNAT
jgi:hypothetical protein